MLACYLGACIGDVGDRLGSVLAGESVAHTVCVSADGNDIDRLGDRSSLGGTGRPWVGLVTLVAPL